MRDTPIINAGWLTYSIDVSVAISAVRRMQQLVSTKAMPPVLETSLDSGSILTNDDLEDSDVLESNNSFRSSVMLLELENEWTRG
jgi:hypothetical protein